MKAAYFNGKTQMRVNEVPAPAPAAGEVVVRISACGVCGSDLHSYLNRWPQPPVVPGHEMVGTVAALGEGVTGFREGDPVVVEPFVPCGECRWCRAGHYNVCPQHQFLSWHRDGAFAEMLAAPARCLLPLPAGPAREHGALVEPLAVAVHGLRHAPLHPSDTVVVLGAGSIGLLAAAGARALGAGKVVLTAKHPHQAALGERLGADYVLPAAGPELEQAVRDLTAGDGADLVVDSVGGGQAADLAVKLARRGGTISLIGMYVMPARVNLGTVISAELHLVGSNCYGIVDSRRDFAVALDLIASGKVDPSPLVTHRFPLAEIQQAFETAADKSTGAVKILVEP